MVVSWTWPAVGVAADALMTLFFYKAYRNITSSNAKIEDCPDLELSPALLRRLEEAPDHKIPYCCITGLVQAQGNALSSHYRDEQGVIQKLLLIEHRTKRQQGFWADCKRIVRDATNFAPFKLVGCRPDDPEVIVTEPFSARHLMEDLRTTYDKYEPSKTTVMEKGIDRMFGDVSKGYQETEQMLNIGTPLVGFGRLVLSKSGIIKITPPVSSADGDYILTRFSKEEVVKILHRRAQMMKTLAIVFGAVGLGALSYMLYVKCKQLYEDYQTKKLLEEFKEQRARPHSEMEEAEGSAETLCVICLVKPREVVVLNCGHVSMCHDCAQLLPEPRKCPICRQRVEKITPIYVS